MSQLVPVGFVSRAAWGAREPECVTHLVKAQQEGTALHYTAGLADMTVASHAGCAARVRGVQAMHMDDRGWCDLAYSFLGCIHGYVFEGRGVGVRTAGQGTNHGNDAYHAVCFLGTDRDGRRDVTDAGRCALRWAIEHCNAWADVTRVRPHSDFHATECPGDELRGWLTAGLPIPAWCAPAAPPAPAPAGGRRLLLLGET